MRNALVLLLSAAFLGGCSRPASHDPNGIWINQAAIDAASQGGNLREALLAYGPNLEWTIDAARKTANVSNGFELDEGLLVDQPDGQWRVDFHGDFHEQLNVENDKMVQAESKTGPEQRFQRSALALPLGAPPGSSFEHALYAAYLGGTWKITRGPGVKGLVLFHPDGKVEGLPGADRYALCLAGDCAAMSGDNDSLWLQLGNQGNVWLFKRDGDELEIFQAVNQAQLNEMPQYLPGVITWVLEKD